jgi:glycogen synthase
MGRSAWQRCLGFVKVSRIPQKVLIYSADFWPTTGGVQSVVMTLAGRFGAGTQFSPGLECTVVTETPAAAALDSDLPFRVVRNPSLIDLLRLLRQCDVVHIAGPALRPLAISFLLRKHVVVEHHGFQTLCPNGLLFHEPTRTACPGHFLAGRHRECWKCNAGAGYRTSLRLWALTFIRQWFCRFVAANITPTRWLGRLLRLPRTFVIYHGVTEHSYLSFPHEKTPQFAFVGRLVSTKGVDLLLRASRELLNKELEFHLLIVGDGPERNTLERLCTELGLASTVGFVGEVPEQDMDALLSDVTAVVIPSLAGEVFGLVAAENMMRGRAAIVPDGGSLAEIAGQTGLTFASGDAKSLAACMEQLLRSPGIAIEMGERARNHSLKHLRVEQMLEDHRALYRKVLE